MNTLGEILCSWSTSIEADAPVPEGIEVSVNSNPARKDLSCILQSSII